MDLERIGDHAAGIARIVQMMGEDAPIKPLVDIPRMAELTSAMLHDAANALLTLDADAAHSKSRQHAGRFSVRESTLIAACRRDSTHGCQRFDAVWGH